MERRHVDEPVRLKSLPRVTRIDGVRLYLTRRWRRGAFAFRLGAMRVYIDRADLDTDWEAWRQIFFPKYGIYASDYEDVVVVDVGAHKGYFAAFALLGGARRVFSFEPESRNFALLTRAATSYREPDRWARRKAAVGATTRRARLLIGDESWSHSLVASAPGTAPLSAEEVDVVSMASVIDEAAADGARRVVVKIDAEGSECEIVLGTEPAAWCSVDEVFLEYHDFATCALDEILEHLARAGLTEREHRHEVLRLLRPGGTRGGHDR